MDRITEALKNILPAEQVSEVARAVEEMMTENYKELKAKFQRKLDEAYAQLAEEQQSSETIAEQGYQQAFEIISSLMKRIDEQREQFETSLEEGFEEAYQELQKEKSKNEKIEVELYEEFDNKLKEMKEFMVDKVDEFLNLQESEIYEQAKREVLNDPTLAEQRVAVNKMAEILSSYMDRDALNVVASSKIDEANKSLDQLKAQLRIVEARNVKLSSQNNKLNEQVAAANQFITESTKIGKKERSNKAQNASGRGHRVVNEETILKEFSNPTTTSNKTDESLTEGIDHLNDLLVLSGISEA
jgi:hypothetical protein